MRRLALTSLLLLFCSSVVWAKPVTIHVRSGEHKHYTRLVFKYPVGIHWALIRKKDGYFLGFSATALRADLGAVFTRIPRSRLLNLRLETHPRTGFDLTLGAGQIATASDFSPGHLVLDIRTGTDTPPPTRRLTELHSFFSANSTWQTAVAPTAPPQIVSTEMLPDARVLTAQSNARKLVMG